MQIKLTDAKHKYYEHNYRASIIAFKEVLALDGKNSKANYGIAQCEYAMKNFAKAKDYITSRIPSTIKLILMFITLWVTFILELENWNQQSNI